MKKLLLIFTIFLAGLIPAKTVHADSEFSTETIIYYDVDGSGLTHITHDITLENIWTDLYATSYTLTLNSLHPKTVTSVQANKRLPLTIKETPQGSAITVIFDDAIVGKGKKRNFTISYSDESLIKKSGEVWEASIPKLSNPQDFSSYKVNLLVPNSFGELSYVSPEPIQKQEVANKKSYWFSQEALTGSSVKAAFGPFQVFSYSLTYHLENPLSKRAYTEIALPPDTSYQKIILSSLTPEPSDIYKDEDGNWIAKYNLEARKTITVNAVGSVQIFSTPQLKEEIDERKLESLKKPTEVWPSDPKIIELAKRLKTPRAIYDYVVSTLTYDYTKVSPTVERVGALQALQNPDNAICMEFTDLFIAIARAAGIPAREINGYAYTDNPQIKPLSLVADVLHSWPEYWDSDKQAWISIDPTWANTTGGQDYFTKLDLRHFAFVIHGQDSYKPYPAGSYKLAAFPQKDIYISFGILPDKREPDLNLSVSANKTPFWGSNKATIEVKNTGVSSAKPQMIDVYFDSQKVGTYSLGELLPYSKSVLYIPVPISLFGYKMPRSVTVTLGDEEVRVSTQKGTVLLSNLITISASVLILIYVFSKFQKKRASKVISVVDYK